MKKVIIVGAGGHAKVIADIVTLSGDFIVGYLDDNRSGMFFSYECMGTTEYIGKETDCYYFIAVGNTIVRRKLMTKNAKWYTAIHPSAVIARDVTIEAGTCVMANAVINPGSKVGYGSIINTSATVDHDCCIGRFVHIAPGVHISGGVCVEDMTWIGVGASVINNIHICQECVLGAGAVVITDICEPGTYVGVPATKLYNRQEQV